ncbi:MAG: hypothetical protein CK427_17105 [Leptospira sp.]|nr:MAG: hypothetical protein CK427_17105 [Leptospira sp.]
MNFSQREGLKKPRTEIQLHDMDLKLRNGIWNAISLIYFSEINPNHSNHLPNYERLYTFFIEFYKDFLIKPIEELNLYWKNNLENFKSFYSTLSWNEVYDLVEFFLDNFPDRHLNETFTIECNRILTREVSGYRIIKNKVSSIITDIEIEAVTTSLENRFHPVREHINQAFLLFSNRVNPDYRNSIKESISSIESLSKLILKNEKTTLTDALTELSKKMTIHPAFKIALEKMYGYTSDANGIRHALLDESNLRAEDARYFLVICSAFVNYISEKI